MDLDYIIKKSESFFFSTLSNFSFSQRIALAVAFMERGIDVRIIKRILSVPCVNYAKNFKPLTRDMEIYKDVPGLLSDLLITNKPSARLSGFEVQFKNKKQAEESMSRINNMMGHPLREGFHIMRVYEKNNFWHLSRYDD